MSQFTFLLFGIFFLAAVQADIHTGEFTDHGKECIKTIGTDEDKMKSLVMVHTVDENNELVKKFFECCFRTFISDTNEIIVDDKITTYVTDVFTRRIGHKERLAKLLAKDCIKHCEGEKGDTRDVTAFKVGRCIMKRFHEIMEEGH